MQTIQKRMMRTIIFITLIMVGLIGRLAQIQLLQAESFSKHHVNLIESSIKQRTQSIVLDHGRGRFTDRNGEALTNDYYPSLILFPFLKDIDWPSEKVANIIGISEHTLLEAIEKANTPFALGGKTPIKLTEEQQLQINQLKIPGVYALNKQVPTDEKLAEHLIGLVRQNEELLKKRYEKKWKEGFLSITDEIGITGLQKAFDEFLLPEGESKLLYHVDQFGHPLFGLDVKYTTPVNPFYPTAVQTTLEKSLQSMVENILEKSGMEKGGVVLLDVETSDVLVMASRPSMNEVNPFSDSGGVNWMMEPQIPGSIFKIVTAAAAIEQDIDLRTRRFNCDLDLYGEPSKKRKLGPLNFEDSFSKSCNYTFAKLAEELMKINPNYMEEYAEILGLIHPVGWQGEVFHYANFIQLPEEKKGRIWGDPSDKYVKKAIAQTAIGQKDVRITPLAVVNMMATIARGGIKKQVRAVSEVQYKNGATLFSFPNQLLDGESLSSFTVRQLQQLLQAVVQNGTGSSFLELPYSIAGKSGTAETGHDGFVNKWFAGYFPIENPKYAFVVVELDVAEKKAKTYPIFVEIINKMYEMEQAFRVA